ncbi:MAG TPA: helix-hairpin-helix domain-containing protein, partial [Candidatus Cybelea sp.]|nr:helix-hairpin-helix domain-containing protein [Candidatus Cybelea sp.]
MDKGQIAEILSEIGTLLELKGEVVFKTRAYSNAARTLEGLNEPLDKLIAENRLGEIKGIGEALQKKITELATTGKLAYYDDLKASIPSGLLDMLQIQGLGPKKVKALNDKLGVETVEQLEKVCREGKVAELDGFGDKTQAKILEGIQFRRQYATRHLLSAALSVAEPILDSLRAHPDVVRCSAAGSLRRNKEVIGDIDFLASSRKPAAVIDYFTQQAGVMSVSAKGDTKASVMLTGGIQADLRVVTDPEFPYALLYFTGGKEHNIVMRQRAIQRGLRLNEYGLFKSDVETRDPKLLVACDTEEDIFQKLGLAFIPPEMREDAGEFAAAEKNEIPRLLEWTQLKGSLHNHSNWSDGHGTLEEIAAYMQELGCAYWAITDHSKSSFQANGLQPQRVREQIKTIRALNKKLETEGSDFQLLTGSEVDILSGGRLDFDDDLLAELDVVVASVHQGFTQDEAEMTKRVIAAV